MNLSAKEKCALTTLRELTKKLDNKIFHVFEDRGTSYGIIGSKKLKYEGGLVFTNEGNIDILQYVILRKDDKKNIISYFKNLFEPINADLPKQITDEFDMEFKYQEEFANFLLKQIETKERKFSLGQYKKI
ncbi:hypothetical protein F8M41_021994 [Gigaspora margarita]|uniref:Uncharacterized protein n=1 Tax=Gigaspora margarita TaxID=4874 RepID=A0A8H4AFR1_GIGMA|nr:hypothetical protein F8M41_021994 [Gigaspora margarita]